MKNGKFDWTKSNRKEESNKGYLHYNKSELIDVLIKRVLLPETIKSTTITSLPERENTKK